MMTDQENQNKPSESENENDDKTKMMAFVLQKFKTSGSKFIMGSQIKSTKVEQKPIPKEIVRPKKERIYDKVPDWDELASLDPLVTWDRHNLLYEAGIIAVVDATIKVMVAQHSPPQLIATMQQLREAMKNADANETKERLFNLMESYGSSSSNDTQNYHLLTSMIRIIFETYPLE